MERSIEFSDVSADSASDRGKNPVHRKKVSSGDPAKNVAECASCVAVKRRPEKKVKQCARGAALETVNSSAGNTADDCAERSADSAVFHVTVEEGRNADHNGADEAAENSAGGGIKQRAEYAAGDVAV